ncbi:MAG: hypothetical protein GC199_07830 [Alphaproteobacteria bacterium]|nr:hypothetical protein [Alphaproteobacteria bacterium]
MGQYLLRHWRGDIDLAQSFWINIFTVNLAIGVALTVATRLGAFDGANQITDLAPLITVFVVTVGTTIVIAVWQIVGCWRSAARVIRARVGTGRLSLGPRFAQGAIILGAIATLPFLWPIARQAYDLALISAGLDEVAEYHIDVVEDELQLVGYINFISAREMLNYLKYNPGITLIYLESAGGRIGPAQALGKAMHERQLKAYVEVECSSACTLAFVAAKERIAHTGARLGFHQSTVIGDVEHDMPVDTIQRDFLIANGIDPAFADRAARVPATTIWYPTLEELADAKVITHVYDGDTMLTVAEWRAARGERARLAR